MAHRDYRQLDTSHLGDVISVSAGGVDDRPARDASTIRFNADHLSILNQYCRHARGCLETYAALTTMRDIGHRQIVRLQVPIAGTP